MKKTIKTLAMGIIAAGILLSGCTKDGATGPQGPAGANGTNGAANIQSFDVAVSNWNLSSNSSYFYGLYTTTTSIDTKAAVLVYLIDGTGANVSLPFTENDVEYYYRNTQNYLEFDVSSASGTSVINMPSTILYKVVIIPPAMMKPNVNTHNYQSVKEAYNL